MKPEGLLFLLLIIAGLIALNIYLRVWLFMRNRQVRRRIRRDETSRGSRDGSR